MGIKKHPLCPMCKSCRDMKREVIDGREYWTCKECGRKYTIRN